MFAAQLADLVFGIYSCNTFHECRYLPKLLTPREILSMPRSKAKFEP